ncbi:DEAD/DEAH box helicase [Aequorivita sinensis]|uniref:DEAD/DEAH box helicase n=1 Tax=Aequorivita sinensis TaxID=1382458 RepID=UPI002FE21B34
MKQYHACYILEGMQERLKEFDTDRVEGLLSNLSCFEVESNFNSNPIDTKFTSYFKVVHNQIVRGIPTKPNIFIEEVFSEIYKTQQRDKSELAQQLGFISYNVTGKAKNNDLFYEALHIVDPRLNFNENTYNTDLLGSSFEKDFLFSYLKKKKASYLSQLFQPQRNIDTIVPPDKANELSRQQVDFAFESPYKNSFRYEKHGIEKKAFRKNVGAIVEIDGQNYHSAFSQKLLDGYRDTAAAEGNWETLRIDNLAEDKVLKWLFNQNESLKDYIKVVNKNFNRSLNESEWREILEQVLSPMAIARLQKVLIDQLISGVLSLNQEEWNIAVIEKDIPAAAIAFSDLKTWIETLFYLSTDDEIQNKKLPKINLTIVSTPEFINSPLHLSENTVLTSEFDYNHNYDLVIDISVLLRSGLEKKDSQPFLKCIKIRSVHYVNSNREIYTSDSITYRKATNKLANDEFQEIEETKTALRYFVQNIFRKSDFRKGQLPILNRALQGESVIGLLPTGGGKSLTYQLASMLQPGMTMVIDPIKSLMQDQYDSLRRIGIDACNYINSKLDRFERNIATNQLTDSQVLFTFISPERLQIQDFRDVLESMFQNSIFFSYCVIDEVHCVSEWGHDFRTSYLSLGKNAIEYCKPKGHPKKLLPIFGLTATASYDVLSDVERELSGNGRTDLDSEAIVRFENSNRDELQYNIVEVIPELEREEKFEIILPEVGKIPMPITPLKSGVKNAIAESKQDRIISLLEEIPKKLDEYNNKIPFLKQKAEERINDQSQRDDVNIELNEFNPKIFYKPVKNGNSLMFKNGGIVFTPHRSWYQGVTDQFKPDRHEQDILDENGVLVYRRGDIRYDSDGKPVRLPLDKRKGIADKIKRERSDMNVGIFMGSSDDDEKVGKEIETKSFNNQFKFINNYQNIMVATKAFGMGIDKPNVRYTIHFNYPGSIESFVQEAGRAGRDRKLALNTILFNQQEIVDFEPAFYNKIKNEVSDQLFSKLNYLRGRQFLKPDLPILCSALEIEDITQNKILNDNLIIKNLDRDNLTYFHNNSFKGQDKEKVMIFELLNNITYPNQKVTFSLAEQIEELTGEDEIFISVNAPWLNIYAGFKRNVGSINLNNFNFHFNFSVIDRVKATQILQVTVDLIREKYPDFSNTPALVHWLKSIEGKNQQPGIEKRLLEVNDGQEINPSIEVHFSNKFSDKEVYLDSLTSKMQQLLSPYINRNNIEACYCSDYGEFIKKIVKLRPDLELGTVDSEIIKKGMTRFYAVRRKDDTDKALFRLMSIGVIDDYTVDYNLKTYTLKVIKKPKGKYIESLFNYIKRYYSQSRAEQEIEKIDDYAGNTEIQKCLGFLTDFIYSEVESKRLRAIDDMIFACQIGLGENGNEDLKDFIFLYFNSKYAKLDYTVEIDGIEKYYSLTFDTNKEDFTFDVVWKYIEVISYDKGGEKDNIKHLRGACLRLLRSNEDNGALHLLKAFTLFALGYGKNKNLFEETYNALKKGIELFSNKSQEIPFDELIENIEKYKHLTIKYSNDPNEVTSIIDGLIEHLYLDHHNKWLVNFNSRYLKNYDS